MNASSLALRIVATTFVSLIAVPMALLAMDQGWPSRPKNLPEVHTLALDGKARDIARLAGRDSSVVSQLDERGRTALFYAVNRATVKALIKAGVSANATDENGQTALMHAAFYNREDALDELLKNGADPMAADQWGNTALHWADSAAVAKRLMRAGLRADVRNKSGDVPTTTALNVGCTEASRLLADEIRRLPGQKDWRLLEPQGKRVLVWPLIHRATDSDDEGVTNGQIAEGSKSIRESLSHAGFELVEAPDSTVPELQMSARARVSYKRPSHPLLGAGWEGEITLISIGTDEVMEVAKAAKADLVVVPVILATLYVSDSIRAVCVSQVSVLDVAKGDWICNPTHGLYEDARWGIYPLAKKKNAAAQSLHKALQPFLYLCGVTRPVK